MKPGCCLPSRRFSLAFAAALAMLLPLPARYVACTTSAGGCPHCAALAAENSAANHAAPSCCQRPHSPRPTAVSAHSNATRHAPDAFRDGIPRCGCKVVPVHRAVPKAEIPAPSAHPATLAMTASPAAPALQASAAAITAADLPAPIPHRVLHCSWLI